MITITNPPALLRVQAPPKLEQRTATLDEVHRTANQAWARYKAYQRLADKALQEEPDDPFGPRMAAKAQEALQAYQKALQDELLMVAKLREDAIQAKP